MDGIKESSCLMEHIAGCSRESGDEGSDEESTGTPETVNS